MAEVDIKREPRQSVCNLSIELRWLLNTKTHERAKAPGELTSNRSRLSNKEAWYETQDRHRSRNKPYSPAVQDMAKGAFL